jgi:hypothetical protein
MERSADVLSAGLLEVADPSLSSRYFLKQVCNIFCMNILELHASIMNYDTFFKVWVLCTTNFIFVNNSIG